MGDLIKSVAGTARIQAILVSWFMPLLVPAFAFVLFVVPDIEGSALVTEVREIAASLGVNRTVLVLILTFTASVFAFANRIFLYQLLEGINWPRRMRAWRIEHVHRLHYDVLAAEREAARAATWIEACEADLRETGDGAGEELRARRERFREERSAALERRATAEQVRRRRGRTTGFRARLRWRSRPLFTARGSSADHLDWAFPYPERREQVMATQVGNALRRIETYAVNTLGVDSQIMWYELYAAAPEPVRADYVDGQLQADSFVCLIYGTWAVSVTAFGSALWVMASEDRSAGRLIVVGVVSAVVGSLLKRGLLASITSWGQTVRSIVNSGWPVVRAAYGLPEPRTAGEQRLMGEVITGLSYYPDSPYYLDRLHELRRLRWGPPSGPPVMGMPPPAP